MQTLLPGQQHRPWGLETLQQLVVLRRHSLAAALSTPQTPAQTIPVGTQPLFRIRGLAIKPLASVSTSARLGVRTSAPVTIFAPVIPAASMSACNTRRMELILWIIQL